MGKEIPLLAEYQDLFKDNVRLQEVLAKLFTDILEFHQIAMNLYSGRGTKASSLVNL
jgi:hypothetical protein